MGAQCTKQHGVEYTRRSMARRHSDDWSRSAVVRRRTASSRGPVQQPSTSRGAVHSLVCSAYIWHCCYDYYASAHSRWWSVCHILRIYHLDAVHSVCTSTQVL